ncbi:Uncharacterized protein DBV15_00101, partial [Temnothorax longispinosus]
MESSFFSRKMFIGGLSWQTSPVVERNDGNSGTSCISCNTSAHRGKFGEGTNGSAATVNVVLNMYAPAGSRSHGRRTLLSASISFCRLADLEQRRLVPIR